MTQGKQLLLIGVLLSSAIQVFIPRRWIEQWFPQSIGMGMMIAIWPPKNNVLSGGSLDRLMCSCGCYEDTESITTFSGKISLFIRHSQTEFFSVGKYLMIGTFIVSIFQVLGTGIFTNTSPYSTVWPSNYILSNYFMKYV